MLSQAHAPGTASAGGRLSSKHPAPFRLHSIHHCKRFKRCGVLEEKLVTSTTPPSKDEASAIVDRVLSAIQETGRFHTNLDFTGSW